MPLLPSRRLLSKTTVVNLRMRGKQPQVRCRLARPREGFLASLAAIQHEAAAADGLIPLPLDSRRRHIHYTHVRTHRPGDVQPEQMSRAAFWQHLERCYKDAYPQADSETGSILKFGIVCKEMHKDARRDEDRSPHHHAAVYCSLNHYWRRVRKTSAEKYYIQLNAVAHDAYATMYQYLRCPTKKKPLFELDATPYYSPRHPEGEVLRELLAYGEKFVGIKRRKVEGSGDVVIRSQFGLAYNWIISNGLRKQAGAVQLEMDAVKELKAGRPQLLDFVKKHKSCLEDQLEMCWSMHEAPQRLARLSKTRLQLLLEAAAPEKACANKHGQCHFTYNSVLAHQEVASNEFCHSVFTALERGRSKGSALMIVGGKDTGKTTVTEPARLIFNAMKTPQSDSFCPLADIRGYEVILWQDFRYNPGHPRQSEQGLRIDEGTFNRLLEGLPTPIGVPKTDPARKDFVYEESPAMIFTGPFQLLAYRNGKVDMMETDQLTCRMEYIFFKKPASGALNRTMKHCAVCWSRWILGGEADWRVANGADSAGNEFMCEVEAMIGQRLERSQAGSSRGASSSGLDPVAAASSTSESATFMTALTRVMDWRQQGLLSDSEFLSAKRALGLK